MNKEESIPWTRERIISVIQMLHLRNYPLNFKYINAVHPDLRRRAEKFFGSWGDAVQSAGLNYDEIKRTKGWATPLLGEDGILYSSKLEGEIANKLFELKKDNKILDYENQIQVSPSRNWTCDFSVVLLNNAKFLLEVNNDKNEEDKISFYENAKILYYKVQSPNNIENIIDRFTSWYSIPLKNTLITSHKNPDGDALASSVAIYDYLLSAGKKVVLKFAGEIPKNLEWVLEDREIVKKVPEWVENIIVLDCAPIQDRLGWEISNIPIYNIDHHAGRLDENDPDNDKHIINACSTCSILFNYFGIKNSILAVGIYTDTLFIKNLTEVLYLLLQLNIDEEKLSLYISQINSNPDKKLWKILQESDIHRCRNGFIIVETKEEAPDIVESFMQILSKLSESTCLIYGKKHDVKIRTSNNLLDVSSIAEEYSGGGHSFASMCNIDGKVSEFKSKIVSIDVPKIALKDGY